jgi:uncharacterized protein YdeI (YjbR/CyaY-like superfamily)
MVSVVAAKTFSVELERVQMTATMSEWIDEAKRPETRARRIAATVDRVLEGKPAH